VTVPLIPLASPLHDSQSVHRILEQTKTALGPEATPRLEWHPLVTEVSQIPPIGSLAVLLVLTGGTEFLGAQVQAEEVLLLVHRSQNSLPAALELRTFFERKGRRASILIPQELTRLLPLKEKAWQAVGAFRRSRLARVGGSASWLMGSQIDPVLIEQRFRIRCEEVSLQEMFRLFEGGSTDDLWRQPWLTAETCGIGAEDLPKADRFAGALLAYAKAQGWDGLALSCFDFLLATGTSGCLALAELNRNHISAGCEGDLPALLTMRLLALLSGRSTFMGNPSWIEMDRVLLAHCTISPSLVQEFRLRTHFESGTSVAVAGTLIPGEYTLVKIAPSLEGIFFAPCRTLPWESQENLCRTQVLLEMKGAERLKRLPLANHLVLVPGDWTKELAEVASILQLPILS
jgi:L-fucose isomerase-like protein